MSTNLFYKIKSGYIPHNETYEIWCDTSNDAVLAKYRLLKYLDKHMDVNKFVRAYSIPASVVIPMMGLVIYFVNPKQCFDFLLGMDRIGLSPRAFCEIMDYLEKRDELEVIKDGRSQELQDV